MIPEVIGGLVVARRLRVGYLAETLAASCPRTGTRYVIKRALPTTQETTTRAARFARERDLSERLLHPGFVPVVARGEHLGLPYFVSPFVPGATLAELSRAGDRLASAALASLGADIAQALLHLHTLPPKQPQHPNGWLHLDVAPSNILIDQEGHARLLDLGSAIPRSESETPPPGGWPCQRRFAAPEQRRAAPVGPSTDLYGLGRALIEFLPAGVFDELSRTAAALVERPPDPRLTDISRLTATLERLAEPRAVARSALATAARKPFPGLVRWE